MDGPVASAARTDLFSKCLRSTSLELSKDSKNARAMVLLLVTPVVDVRAALVEGSYHDVDSSVLALQLAAQGAFKERMQAGLKLLRPIMKVEAAYPRRAFG
ncbi:uncharacterized protein A4U43_C04F35620 [Asparagus officinalis]|uniref:Translation elongation factor EFG/EF2 domain-containing protein n=1 Tax=Asparagus officinalis TaxID=4686 RepID=A0A5P1FBA3_ASPOF|nr:elongation factor G, chloroplastic-like [Asparagus officinalis]ONK73810.1 uncharacterized protein A4U43_C04F35620 [Asparagus officinalis]